MRALRALLVLVTTIAGAAVFAVAPAWAGPIATDCAGSTSGTTFTLTADCDTTTTLTVPDGFTVAGGGHTITAHDPAGGFFKGPVLTNAAGATSMTLTDLTVRGTGFATNCGGTLIGILYNDAGGSMSNVTVRDITQHSGCILGINIRVNALAGTARTVTLTGVTSTGFQRSGLVSSGLATVNVTGSTFGPADVVTPGLVAQNAVQYGVGGAGGTFTGNTVVGRGFGGATSASTGMLLFTASDVTIANNTITGAGTDVGISVNANSTNVTIANNAIGRTAPDSPDASGFGVSVDSTSAAGTSLVCNTFSGWAANLDGITQPPCIATTTLPHGTQGSAYTTKLAATVTSPPATWALAAGSSLPAGLTLAADGTITGTPTVSGTFTFTATVTDADQASASRAFTIVIVAAAPAPSPSPTVSASVSPSSSEPALAASGPSPAAAPLAALGAGLLVGGAGLVWLSRRIRGRRS